MSVSISTEEQDQGFVLRRLGVKKLNLWDSILADPKILAIYLHEFEVAISNQTVDKRIRAFLENIDESMYINSSDRKICYHDPSLLLNQIELILKELNLKEKFYSELKTIDLEDFIKLLERTKIYLNNAKKRNVYVKFLWS